MTGSFVQNMLSVKQSLSSEVSFRTVFVIHEHFYISCVLGGIEKKFDGKFTNSIFLSYLRYRMSFRFDRRRLIITDSKSDIVLFRRPSNMSRYFSPGRKLYLKFL